MKNPLFLFIIFAVVGLPCLLFSPYLANKTIQQGKTWEEAPGVIVGFTDGKYPDVSFLHGTDTIYFRANFSSSDMNMGDAVTVYYPSSDPSQAEIKSFMSNWGAPLILFVLGLIFTSISVFGIRRQKMKSDIKKELFIQKKGKVLSVPALVRKDTQYTVNGVNPFVIEAQWMDTTSNTIYTFTSEYSWVDPS